MENVKHKEEIINPSRYNKGGISVWQIQRAFQGPDNINHWLEHLRFGAIEYILRCWDKNGIEDLKKAANLLNEMIKYVEDGDPDRSANC